MKAIHETLPSNHQFRIFGYKTYRNDINLFKKLKTSFSNYIKKELEDFSGVNVEDFTLENYHKHLEQLSINHHDFISKISRVVSYENIDMGFIENLPVGLSFFGRKWSEPLLIEIAYAYEQGTNHRRSPQFLETD